MSEVAVCYRCDHPASDQLAGTIYVRRQIDGHWQSVPICLECWTLEEPDRIPVRVLHPPEAHDGRDDARGS